jgi:hypothetical protein
LGRISPHLGPEIFGQVNECWQTAMETLLLVAERDGSEMMARIGMMQALNRHSAKADPAPRRKRAKACRVIR